MKFQEFASIYQNRKSIFFIPRCHEKSTCFGKCFFRRYQSTAWIGDMRLVCDTPAGAEAGRQAPVTAREVRAAAGTSALGVGGGPYGDCQYRVPFTRPWRWPLPGDGGPGSSRPTVVIDAVCHSTGLGDGRHRLGGTHSASDTLRRMSSRWSQCPWGRPALRRNVAPPA